MAENMNPGRNVTPERRRAQRIFSILTIVLGGLVVVQLVLDKRLLLPAFGLPVIGIPLEVRSQFLFSLTFVGWFVLLALFLGCAIARLFLWKKRKPLAWVGFSFSLVVPVFGFALSVLGVVAGARSVGGYGYRVREDLETLYVQAGRPDIKIVQQDEGSIRKIRDRSGIFRYSQELDLATLDGEWEVYEGGIGHVLTATFEDGVMVKRAPGRDWLPGGARIGTLQATSTLPDDPHDPGSIRYERYFVYTPRNAMDGNPRTVWFADSGRGAGETLHLRLDSPVSADMVRVTPRYLNVSRGPSMELAVTLAGTTEVKRLEGAAGPVDIAFGASVTFDWADIEIRSVTGNITAAVGAYGIAEIEFYEFDSKLSVSQDPGVSWNGSRYVYPDAAALMVRLGDSSGYAYYGSGYPDYDLYLSRDGHVSGTVGMLDDYNTSSVVEDGEWSFDSSTAELTVYFRFPYARLMGFDEMVGPWFEMEMTSEYLALEMLSPDRIRVQYGPEATFMEYAYP